MLNRRLTLFLRRRNNYQGRSTGIASVPKRSNQCPFRSRLPSGRKHPDRLTPAQFRAAVWARDRGRDRATGEPVSKSDPSWDRLGEVAHLYGRNVRPEWAVDPDRAVLLSRTNHILSDGRGGYRLKLTDPETGNRVTDASKLIRFTMVSREGRILWTRVS